MTALRYIACFALLLVPAFSRAALVVTPNAPLSTQGVRIRLVNQYNSAAVITSATLTRNADRFEILQIVDLACPLPAAPTLTSEFNVGALPKGTYTIVALTQYTSSFPGCASAPLTQESAFTVSDPNAIPVGTTPVYILVACLVLWYGAKNMRVSNARRPNMLSDEEARKGGSWRS